jgi:hypothetical protein
MPAKPWDEPKLLKLEAGEAKAGGSKLYADGAFIS